MFNDHSKKIKYMFKSKTFWTGLGSIATGVGFIIIGNTAEGIQLIFSGASIIFLRHAMYNAEKANPN